MRMAESILAQIAEAKRGTPQLANTRLPRA
jgi:hypothetical protein